jgi:hypothetical protein
MKKLWCASSWLASVCLLAYIQLEEVNNGPHDHACACKVRPCRYSRGGACAVFVLTILDRVLVLPPE